VGVNFFPERRFRGSVCPLARTLTLDPPMSTVKTLAKDFSDEERSASIGNVALVVGEAIVAMLNEKFIVGTIASLPRGSGAERSAASLSRSDAAAE